MTSVPSALAALTGDSAGLGLRAGEVRVVDHNAEWASLAADVASHIKSALSSDTVQVEHVGSTSVPGLAAKPLLDIAVGVDDKLVHETIIAELEAAGFQYQLDLGMYGGLLFTVSIDPQTVVAHVHVVSLDDFQWRWYLVFRNGLRSDDQLRSEYESLKRDAAITYAGDREGYSKAKFDWVLAAVSGLDGTPPPV